MEGKVALITGTTSGIGQASVLGLARLNATVVLVARNDGREQPTSAHSHDIAIQERLWQVSAELTRLNVAVRQTVAI